MMSELVSQTLVQGMEELTDTIRKKKSLQGWGGGGRRSCGPPLGRHVELITVLHRMRPVLKNSNVFGARIRRRITLQTLLWNVSPLWHHPFVQDCYYSYLYSYWAIADIS